MFDEISIKRMRWLLEQRGYSFALEDDLHKVLSLKKNRRPDFLVDTGHGVRFLAEVKAFETPTVLDESTEFTGAIFGADTQSRINAGPIARAGEVGTGAPRACRLAQSTCRASIASRLD